MASLLNEIFRPVLERLPENNRMERIWILGKSEFKKRYYDSYLGLFWALLNPLLLCGVYLIAFEFIRNERFDNYVIYLFGGLICWLFITELGSKGMSIIKQKRYLFESIQFNWVDVFIATAGAASIGLIFNFMAYFIMSLLLGVEVSIHILWGPILLANLILMGLGISMIMATLIIFIKDINHLWSVITRLGFWTAPIIIPLDKIEAIAPQLLYIHPATPVIMNIRNCLFYGELPLWHFFIWGWVYAIIVFIVGFLLFKHFSHKALENI